MKGLRTPNAEAPTMSERNTAPIARFQSDMSEE